MIGRTASRLPNAAVSLFLAIGLVIVVFPEIVFLGGSLSPTGLNEAVNRAVDRRAVRVYPTREDHSPELGKDTGPSTWQLGIRDIGARNWQLEPATKFMHRAIWGGESPFWNPYSAAGSLGVETIVDLKMSPFVVAVALLGASATAFTFVSLTFIVLALYCLQQFFTCTLGVGRLAATAACVVFLLNGFAASDINSQIGAPYVLFPVVLYTLAEQGRRSGPFRFLLAVVAYASLLCTTFWTVGGLMLLLIHGVVLVVDVSRGPDESRQSLPRRIVGAVGRQAVVPATALLATAYVWLPVADALRQGGGDIAQYGERALRTKDSLELLTILTPWHLFHAADIDSYRRYIDFYAWTVYLGIVPLLLLATCWPRATGVHRRLLLLTCGLGIVGLVELAGLPALKELAGLPVLRTVGQPYWGSLAAAAAVLAVGVGVAILVERGVSVWGAQVGGGVFVAAFVIALLATRNIPLTHFAKVSISVAFLLILAFIALVVLAARRPEHRGLLVTVAVALMGAELLAYQPHVRLRRFDLDSSLPRYIAYVRDNLHGHRILNAGRQGIFPEWGTALGIPQIETFTTTQLPHYRDFYLRHVNPASVRRFLDNPGGSAFTADASALDLLSVRFLIVDDSMSAFEPGVRAEYPLAYIDRKAGIRVYENPDPFPRAYLSPALLTPEQTYERYLQGAPAFERGATGTSDRALLDAARQAGIPSQGSDVATPGTARVTRYENDEVEIEVDASNPAVLVVTDTYQKNWHTTVNGHDRHLGRVNTIMRGVVVPAGHSTVVFRYSSQARRLGALVSLVTIVSVLTLAALYARRSRRRRKE